MIGRRTARAKAGGGAASIPVDRTGSHLRSERMPPARCARPSGRRTQFTRLTGLVLAVVLVCALPGPVRAQAAAALPLELATGRSSFVFASAVEGQAAAGKLDLY